MDINDVFLKLPYHEIEEFLRIGHLVNTDELTLLAKGLPSSAGVGVGTVCYSTKEAFDLIEKQVDYIYCKYECSPDDIVAMEPQYCKGVMTLHGGTTSHAAVVCRGLKLTCVSGISEFNSEKDVQALFSPHGGVATIDGNSGAVYGGHGEIENNNRNIQEIKAIYELLKVAIKCNIVSCQTASNVWRLWDVIVLDRKYPKNLSAKRIINNMTGEYTSFVPPSKCEVENIRSKLYDIYDGRLIVEGLIEFMVSELSAQVSLGHHHLYVRPLLDPLEN